MRILPLLLLLSIGALSAQAAVLVGNIDVDSSVTNTGTARLSIPIKLPPGVNGHTPNLGIDYDSSAGNGILGMGFSLSGLSSIRRDTANLSQDGAMAGSERAISYDSDDKYSLDGRRLKEIASGYFRTEVDNFSFVKSTGTSFSPEFELKTKAGDVMTYGGSSGSVYPASNKRLVWLLEEHLDRSGNAIDYTYVTQGNTKQISEIEYGASTHRFKVVFGYENRNDVRSRYVAGTDVGISKRLKTIKVYSSGSLIHTYTMVYDYCPVRELSRLQRVDFSSSESGASGTMSTEFDWYDSNNGSDKGWQYKSSYRPPHNLLNQFDEDLGTRFLDLNGDGFLDMLWHRENDDDGARLNSGSSWTPNTSYKPPHPIIGPVNGFDNQDYGIRFPDLNGDGLPDMVWSVVPSSLGDGARLNSGSGWTTIGASSYELPYPLVNLQGSGDLGSRFVDVNGDGLVDYVWNRGDQFDWADGSSFESGAAINTGSGWQDDDDYAPPVIVSEYNGNDVGTRFVDLNGDGLMDVVYAYVDSINDDNVHSGAFINENGSWLADPDYELEYPIVGHDHRDMGLRFVDLNGDGLTDYVWGMQYNNTGPSSLLDEYGAKLNTGTGWVDAPNDFIPPFPFVDNDGKGLGSKFVDLNGDGLLDLAHNYYDHPYSSVGTGLNTGGGFETSGTSAYDLEFPLDYEGQRGGSRVEDINGDGLVDQVWARYNTAGSQLQEGAELNKGTLSGVLKSVTDNFDLTTTFEYKQLTDDSVYTKETGAVYPNHDIMSPLYVVSSLEKSTGLSGSGATTSTTTYTYAGGVRDVQGRGFLGFRVFDSHESQTGFAVTDIVRLDFPYVGLVLSSTKSYGSTAIRTVHNEYDYKPLNGGKTLFPFVLESTVEGHLTPKTKVVTEYDYDDAGNLTDKDVTRGLSAQPKFITRTDNDYPSVSSFPSSAYSSWEDAGLLERSTVLSDAPNSIATRDEDVTRVTDYGYDSKGRLDEITADAGNAELELRTTLKRDTEGRVYERLIDPIDGAEITVETLSSLDSSKRFYTVSKNTYQHQTILDFDSVWGRIESSTNPNDRETTFDYDFFGRETEIDSPLDSKIDINYTYSASVSITNDSGETNQSKYKSTATSPDKPTVITWFDALDRVIRVETEGADGRFIRQDSTYNTKGQKDQVSEKYYVGDTRYWMTYSYDNFGRLDYTTMPDGTRVDREYSGNSSVTVVKDDGGLNQKTKYDYNPLGSPDVVTSYNDANQALTLTHRYDGLGRVLETEDDRSRIVSMFYNLQGKKIRQIDPDMGDWEYDYDARGRLQEQTDAEQNRIEIDYDDLDRMTEQRLIAADTSLGTVTRNFYYDGTGKFREIGKLHLEKTSDGYRQAYYYDHLGREFLTLSKIEGRWIYEQVTFDASSRPTHLTHYWRPPGMDQRAHDHHLAWYSFSQETVYNAEGYVTEVRDGQGHTWWSQPEYSAQGQVSSYMLGNGLETVTDYNPANHRIEGIQVKADQALRLDFDYDYDDLGNLSYRADLLNGQTEGLLYDDLSRLKTSTVNAGGASSVTSIVYDDFGNIESRTGIGSYAYVSGTNRVSSAGGRNFPTYNSNGAITSVTGAESGEVKWTAFNSVHHIKVDDARSLFTYDSGGNRVAQTRQIQNGGWMDESRKTYIGSLFEQEQVWDDSGSGIWDFAATRVYIATPAGVIGSWVNRPAEIGSATTRTYFHKDHLGSVIAESEDPVLPEIYGTITRKQSFAAFGTERDPDDWAVSASSSIEPKDLATDRGFTGHEMLNSLKLVHMNGRIYDQRLGRFLSPDPIIQAPDNLQNYNRYSYVFNSPLSFTDPSGFVSVSIPSKIGETLKTAQYEGVDSNIKSQFLSGVPQDNATGFVHVAQVEHDTQADSFNLNTLGADDSLTTNLSVVGESSHLSEAFEQWEVDYFNNYGRMYTGMTVYINNDYGANVIAEISAELTPIGLFTAGRDVFDNPGSKLAWLGLAPGFPRAGVLNDLPINQTVIIGENMKRVNRYADNFGGTTIDAWLDGRKWTPQLNDDFISEMKAQGRKIQDIGPDFSRRLRNSADPSQGRPPSDIYGGERRELLDYGNYERMYQRSGKYEGGVQGFD